MQTGTRLNALPLMRGTVFAQQWGSFRVTAAFLRNTLSEYLSSELPELDSDVFVLALRLFTKNIVLTTWIQLQIHHITL